MHRLLYINIRTVWAGFNCIRDFSFTFQRRSSPLNQDDSCPSYGHRLTIDLTIVDRGVIWLNPLKLCWTNHALSWTGLTSGVTLLLLSAEILLTFRCRVLFSSFSIPSVSCIFLFLAPHVCLCASLSLSVSLSSSVCFIDSYCISGLNVCVSLFVSIYQLFSPSAFPRMCLYVSVCLRVCLRLCISGFLWS